MSRVVRVEVRCKRGYCHARSPDLSGLCVLGRDPNADSFYDRIQRAAVRLMARDKGYHGPLGLIVTTEKEK